MSLHPAYRPIVWLSFIFILFCSQKAAADSKADFFYITADNKSYTATEVITLYKKQALTQTENSINLGLNVHNVWLIVKPTTLSSNKFLVFENAHLDVIKAYFYSNDELITIKETGDQLPFDLRDVNHNFPNLKIPPSTSLIVLNVKTEGPMLVPMYLFSLENYFDYAYKYGIFHWTYFGFIFLIIISSVIVLFWLKESIYFYYILCTLTTGLITAVDYGYTFQYLWPSYPAMNSYSMLFYALTFFSVLFSEKLFNTKQAVPKLYVIYKIIYATFAVMILVLLFAPYNTGLILFFYFSLVIRLFSIGTAVFYYVYFKTSTSKFFLLGWIAYTASALLYYIYLAGVLPFSIFYNNIVQIGSGIQIIFFNTAILGTIDRLKKEKEHLTYEAQKEFNKNDITLHSIFDGMLQSLWIIDKDFTLVKWNSKFRDNVKNILKIDLDNQDAGRRIHDVFSREEVDFWIPFYKRVFEGEDIYFERTYAQSARTIEYYLHPINIDGETTSVLVISNDITKRIETREAAKKNEITLQSVFNGIRQSIWMLDNNYRMVKWNDNFRDNLITMIQFELKEEHIGKKIQDIFKEDYLTFWLPHYNKALQGEIVSFERKYLAS
ncbi:MAG TPA: 7TM diverse intracellular signaling domain-containing protein, partial [Cytophagaceae bacterium]|nr:7TM diverse intracellular signaling domain-containing protein [Cytophagaceae bacterium]